MCFICPYYSETKNNVGKERRQAYLVLYTDHDPLTFLHRMKSKNRRLLNWSLILQEYSLDIRHIRGIDNVCADTLSRSIT